MKNQLKPKENQEFHKKSTIPTETLVFFGFAYKANQKTKKTKPMTSPPLPKPKKLQNKNFLKFQGGGNFKKSFVLQRFRLGEGEGGCVRVAFGYIHSQRRSKRD